MSNHATVAHNWFHQISKRGYEIPQFSNGNMFYRNRIIYSYGKHFALAIRFDDKVVVNSKGYSNSTTKHFGHTYNAIDMGTHEMIRVPLNEAYHISDTIEFKNVYKHIDFESFIYTFDENVAKLGNARKPEIYIGEIEILKSRLNDIFSLWRGSKTLALKTKGIRSILNFEFNEDVKNKMKARRMQELKKAAAKKKAGKKEAFAKLLKYEAGENINLWNILGVLDINTAIRVVEYLDIDDPTKTGRGIIETSKGMKIDLAVGLRVFKMWQAGKGLGVTIKTVDGSEWTCTKVNGIMKFGCHVVDFKQAERVLTPYL